MTGPGGIPEAPPVLRGERVYRIHWVLGTDRWIDDTLFEVSARAHPRSRMR